MDLVLTRALYAESGVPSYWPVDPAEPSVRAWQLADGAYVEVGSASGTDVLALSRPFPVGVRPSDLL